MAARCLVVSILLVLALVGLSSTAASGGAQHHLGWVVPAKPVCRGSTAECQLGMEVEEDGEEFEMMDSEISRRILAATKYISYGALQRNTVPCSRRGASYYNCKPGAQANPYSRGCSAITRCRS